MASRVIFDIETTGSDFDAFDEQQQEYLLRYAETDEDRARIIESLALWAPTASVIAIALLNPDTGQGRVYYQSNTDHEAFREEAVEYVPGTERDLLQGFWKDIAPYGQVITFNGRSFDAPLVMLRSAILGVTMSKDLLPSRYNASHLDLLEQFTCFGAARKFNLHFYARTFDIPSPKAGGITGKDIPRLFREGEHRQIARYCMNDVQATNLLLARWLESVKGIP
ncbi:MAG: ribonuclease H-like domain-containing protein [Parcubacteria group bacterium]|nr:ribonuclease H-like domain-containing protein [Parcubacteria group bacterium]